MMYRTEAHTYKILPHKQVKSVSEELEEKHLRAIAGDFERLDFGVVRNLIHPRPCTVMSSHAYSYCGQVPSP